MAGCGDDAIRIRSGRRGVVAAVVSLALLAPLATESRASRTASAPAEVVLAHGLSKPTGLALNPRDGSLWIVNQAPRAYDYTLVIRNGFGPQANVKRFDDLSFHYLARPMAIAFSPSLPEHATAALIGGGPTLWTSEEELFRGARESHLDMVHHTEMGLGIAPGADDARREYWVFNGHRGSLDRYFFNEPHELGGMDHSDGRVYRYAKGSLKRVQGVPGHVAFDRASGRVFVADTGNGRVAVLRSGPVPANAKQLPYSGAGRPVPERLFEAAGTRVQTFARGLRRPAGLLLHRNRLLVGEHATGRIVVYTLGGLRVRTIDTGVGPNALTGLAADVRGRIYFLDAKRNRLLRLTTPVG